MASFLVFCVVRTKGERHYAAAHTRKVDSFDHNTADDCSRWNRSLPLRRCPFCSAASVATLRSPPSLAFSEAGRLLYGVSGWRPTLPLGRPIWVRSVLRRPRGPHRDHRRPPNGSQTDHRPRHERRGARRRPWPGETARRNSGYLTAELSGSR